MSVSSNYMDFSEEKFDPRYDSRIAFDYMQHGPVSTWTSSSLNNLKFKCNYRNTPFMWDKSYFEFGAQILQNDRSTVIDSDDVVFRINNSWSTFKNMSLRINETEISKIDKVWLVNNVISLGLCNNDYAESVLSDMDFIIDKERVNRESYVSSSYNEALGLFEEVSCNGILNELNTYAVGVLPVGRIPLVPAHGIFTITIYNANIKNLDISYTDGYYVDWYVIINNPLNTSFPNQAMEIIDYIVTSAAGILTTCVITCKVYGTGDNVNDIAIPTISNTVANSTVQANTLNINMPISITIVPSATTKSSMITCQAPLNEALNIIIQKSIQ